jgi:hypothetical protein
MANTFGDLVQRCLVELRMEPGVSVQQYAEDTIAAILQRQFNTFFDHYWWPRYYHASPFTLNGTTGAVIEDLTKTIKRIDDVRHIFLNGDSRHLAAFPIGVNYAVPTFRPYYSPHPSDKIFIIFPQNTVGTVNVTYRTLPDRFKPDDEVLIDGDLLVMATCFNYLSDDEDSPNSIKKFQDAAAKREAQMREAMNRGPIPFGNAGYSPFVDWMTNP